MQRFKSGFWAILAAAIVFASYGVWLRLIGKAFGSISQTALFGIVAIVIALIMSSKNLKVFKMPREKIFKLIVMGVLDMFATLAFIYANGVEKLSVAVFMLYVGLLTTSFVMGWLVFKEKLNLTKIVALLIVLLGLLFTINFNFGGITLGVLSGIVCGFLSAIVNGFTKSFAEENKYSVVFYRYLATSCVALILIYFSGEVVFKEVTPLAIFLVILFGCSLVLINNLLMIGFKKFDFTLGQIVLASEIFFVAIFGFVFFSELPTWYELLGGILIFTGAVIVNFDLAKLGKNYKKMIRK